MGRRGRVSHAHHPQKSFHRSDKCPRYKSRDFGPKKSFSQPSSRLSELDVGIDGYVGEHDGLSAVIKSRFSDFHVNEISIDGNIVKLTDTSVPKEEACEKPVVDTSVISEEIWGQLDKLKEGTESKITIEVTDKSKEDRKKIHEVIRCKYEGALRSNTEDSGDKKLVAVFRSQDEGGGKRDRRTAWPAERGGPFVHFVLYKENLDTMSAVNLIASKLRLKANSIKYCGTKDRRGKTSQLLSVYKIEPSRLASVGKGLRNVALGNYTFKPEPLKLGYLKGNLFRIALRNVSAPQEKINDVLSSLKEKGFLNFYGLQRFGNFTDVPTYEIGKQLLLGNWEKAVDLILAQRVGEGDANLEAARRTWAETRNAKESLSKLRYSDSIEGKLLKGLVQHGPNDYMNALEYIPVDTRLLYLHSYQSLLWNKVASRRLSKYGLKPIVGDLIWEEDSSQDLLIEEMMDVDTKDGVDCSETDSSSMKEKGNVGKPVVLTEDTVNSAKMEDVVLPLPGYDVIYPGGEVGSWYKDMLEEAGITSEILLRQNGKYCLRGTYRRVITIPNNLTWKIMKYKHPEDTLILSDIEEMEGQQLRDISDGEMTAVVLSFVLPPSSYATMALREITKQDTSASFQVSIQKAAQSISQTSCHESSMEQAASDSEDFDAKNVDTAMKSDM